jgi:hypothetical protein
MAEQTKAIQKFDNNDQRLALLVEYNPSAHLLKWEAYDKTKKKTVVVSYYPASWRLYELRLRYPTAKFDVSIILMDQERNFCIVCAKLFVGSDYETAEIRSIAHKQGFLTELDRVETKAKARAARDLGISTELALDMDDVPEGEPDVPTPQRTTKVSEEPPTVQVTLPLSNERKVILNTLFERAMALRLLKVGNARNFLMWASELLGKPIPSPDAFSLDDLDTIERSLSELESQQQAS